MKKMIIVIVIAFFALSLSFAALSQQLNSESTLLDDKIEALACGESGQTVLYQTMGRCPNIGITYACTAHYTSEKCRRSNCTL